LNVLGPAEAAAFERCIRDGGVAIFPADTVYGLACNPESASAIQRMYAMKGRPPATPSAVMFFQLEAALNALGRLGERTESALRRLLPGPVTVVLPRPGDAFPLAGGGGTVGARVPVLTGPLEPLAAVSTAVLQTSANLTGEPSPRALSDIPAEIRKGADLALDAGPRSGTPSTVVDLTGYEDDGGWRVLREGALDRAKLTELLTWPGAVT
jgi:L-threonylcarbamoyladenylate synthase